MNVLPKILKQDFYKLEDVYKQYGVYYCPQYTENHRIISYGGGFAVLVLDMGAARLRWSTTDNGIKDWEYIKLNEEVSYTFEKNS